jgi:hypothetical protein
MRIAYLGRRLFLDAKPIRFKDIILVRHPRMKWNNVKTII